MKRWLGFAIVILVGITAGLYYGERPMVDAGALPATAFPTTSCRH